MTPRVSQLVSLTLTHLFGNEDFVADVRFAPYTRALVFKDDQERPVVAVWNHKPDLDWERTVPIRAKVDFGEALEGVYDMMYTPKKVAAGDGEIELTSAPIYYRGKPGTLKEMLTAFRGARVGGGNLSDRCRVSVNPVEPGCSKVALKDNVSGAVSNYFVKIEGGLSDRRETLVRLENERQTYTGLVVRRAPQEATIDTLDWEAYPSVRLGNVIGKPGEDYRGQYRLAWNSAGLFLEVTIGDSEFGHTVYRNSKGIEDHAARWDNDSLQIGIDPYADARAAEEDGYGEDDYQYHVYPEPDGSKARVYRVRQCDWQLGLATSAPQNNTFADDMPTAFMRIDGGYRYRVFFPAKYLLPARLEKGAAIGFGLMANDAPKVKPGGEHSVKGCARRTGALSNTTQPGEGIYNSPKTYPVLLLWEK